MRPIRRTAPIISLLAAACGASAQGIPEGYTLVELLPLGGGDESFVSAINDRGEIVGRTVFGTGPIATAWDATGAAALITLTNGGSATGALSINNEGSMLVNCTGCGPRPGVRLGDGSVLLLPDSAVPGSLSVEPSLTSDGSVGGLLVVQDGDPFDLESYAVVWSLAPGPQMEIDEIGPFAIDDPIIVAYENGILSDNGEQVFGAGSGLGSANFVTVDTRTGAVDSFAGTDIAIPYDINASGQFVGVDGDGGGDRAFLFTTDGASTQIDPINCQDFSSPGNCYAKSGSPLFPRALNDRAVVVGASAVLVDDGTGFPALDGVSGFVWTEATGAIDLLELVDDGSADGWQLVRDGSLEVFGTPGPIDINEEGWIVGNGVNPNGDEAAYLLIPRSPCAGDTNRDGLVTPADFSAWIQAFNTGCD